LYIWRSQIFLFYWIIIRSKFKFDSLKFNVMIQKLCLNLLLFKLDNIALLFESDDREWSKIICKYLKKDRVTQIVGFWITGPCSSIWQTSDYFQKKTMTFLWKVILILIYNCSMIRWALYTVHCRPSLVVDLIRKYRWGHGSGRRGLLYTWAGASGPRGV
jgi:hypothetical protein